MKNSMALLNNSDHNIGNQYYVSRNWLDNDYYYIRCLPTFEDKKFEVPEEIIKSNCIIVVNFEMEPYKLIVDKIYIELVCIYNINPNRILLISENPDLLPYIFLTAAKFNKKTIKYEYISGAEISVGLQVFQSMQRFNEVYKETIPKKTFLAFNRRWRPHRPFFVAMCVANNLLDNGYISLGVADDIHCSWSNSFPVIIDLCSNDLNLLQTLKKHEDKILSLPNLYLDTTDLINSRHMLKNEDIDNDITDFYYKESLISVVSETMFFENNGRFLSEKTFKPIAYKHPFIIIGPYKTLSLLKELGYKTYEPFIDESYDNEKNPLARMQLIIKELKKLSKMTENEIMEFKKNTYGIATHNFMHLLKRKKTNVKKN